MDSLLPFPNRQSSLPLRVAKLLLVKWLNKHQEESEKALSKALHPSR
jgi:hypothetical protein